MKKVLSVTLCLLILISCVINVCSCSDMDLKSAAKAIVKEEYDGRYDNVSVKVTNVEYNEHIGFAAPYSWLVYGTVKGTNKYGKKCEGEWKIGFAEDRTTVVYDLLRFSLNEIE